MRFSFYQILITLKPINGVIGLKQTMPCTIIEIITLNSFRFKVNIKFKIIFLTLFCLIVMHVCLCIFFYIVKNVG